METPYQVKKEIDDYIKELYEILMKPNDIQKSTINYIKSKEKSMNNKGFSGRSKWKKNQYTSSNKCNCSTENCHSDFIKSNDTLNQRLYAYLQQLKELQNNLKPITIKINNNSQPTINNVSISSAIFQKFTEQKVSTEFGSDKEQEIIFNLTLDELISIINTLFSK